MDTDTAVMTAGLDRRELLGTTAVVAVGSGLLVPPLSGISLLLGTKGTAALTFDDGPNPLYTEKVINLLQRRGVPGTFFMVGAGVWNAKTVVKHAASHGHSIQVHGWNHARLDTMSRSEIEAQLSRSARAVKGVTGVRPTLFRPPYGYTNAKVVAAGKAVGLRQRMWNAPAPMKPASVSGGLHEVLGHVENARRNGQRATILFHDGSGNRPMMLEILPLVISRLRADGWTFVRLT